MKRDQRTRGRFLGGTSPFGYRLGADGELIPQEGEQEAIREMRAMKEGGASLRAIAEALQARGHSISHVAVSRVMASYARAADWAGIGFSLSSRRRHAVVSSRTPWHQSSQLARTAEGPWVPTLRLDAGDPLDRILKALNDFQPHVLTAYAKTARVLAESTLAGDLRISPESVVCASEPLSRETRQRIVEAWGVQPFDIYGATETAGIAAECEHHAGLHLLRLSMTRTCPRRLWSLGPRCWSPCCSAVHCR